MFKISQKPLDGVRLAAELKITAAGALVIFEGTVRSENKGRAVTKLEYEASEAIAQNEFKKIVDEARQQFDFIQAKCVHRVGTLMPGEAAVWVGVVSVHRSAAFAVCKYLIDELKKRLPIWKKEFYVDGDSGWINAP